VPRGSASTCRTTTTSKTNEQSQNVEENEDVLASLKDFLCTEEKTGPKISLDLAEIVNASMKQKISEDKIKSMMIIYCRPENCEALAPVPVNLPVCKCIRKRTQQADIMLQRNQGLICKGLIPTVTVLDTMLSKSKVGQGLTQEELLKSTQQLKDAFVFMQMAYADMNVKRSQATN